jgi:hypothetical protein
VGQQIIPIAEFRPDMPDLAEATSIAVNVVPVTPQSYGPLQSLSAYAQSALDSQCIGAISVQGDDLSVYIFAGTVDKLYELTGLSADWADVSGEVYSTAQGENWNFVLFDDSVIATNFGDEIQTFALGVSATFGPLFTAPAWATSHVYSTLGAYVLANGNRYVLIQTGTSAASGTGPSGTGDGISDGSAVWNYQSGPPPMARHMCTPKDFLMLANTEDPVGGLGPQRVWWSTAGDATSFPSPGSDAAIQGQSDYNDFEGNFGEINGVVDSLANADVAIFFRHAVWRGLYVGPPDVFDFFPTENVRGCPAPNSLVPIGAIVWYLGEDGFYSFDGAQSTPIGTDKFDQWFWSLVNRQYLYNVIGAANVPGKMVMWAFPSTASGSGLCDTILIYRWDINRASYAIVGTNAIEWIMRSLTFGINMDDMPAFGYTDTDTLPASLDSPIWVGGALQLSSINGLHQLAYFNGPNMQGQVATQTKQMTPGRRTYMQSARPLVDLTNGVPTVAFAARVNLYDPEVFGPAVPPDVSGECPQRSDGRYHNAMVTLPAGAIWTHIGGVDTTFIPGGFR